MFGDLGYLVPVEQSKDKQIKRHASNIRLPCRGFSAGKWRRITRFMFTPRRELPRSAVVFREAGAVGPAHLTDSTHRFQLVET